MVSIEKMKKFKEIRKAAGVSQAHVWPSCSVYAGLKENGKMIVETDEFEQICETLNEFICDKVIELEKLKCELWQI